MGVGLSGGNVNHELSGLTFRWLRFVRFLRLSISRFYVRTYFVGNLLLRELNQNHDKLIGKSEATKAHGGGLTVTAAAGANTRSLHMPNTVSSLLIPSHRQNHHEQASFLLRSPCLE